MKLSICLALVSIPAIAQNAPVNVPIKVVNSECPIGPFQIIPLFRGGYCIKNHQGSLQAWGPDGRPAFATVPRLPQNAPLDITDVAASPGAGFVLAIFSTSGSGLVLLDEYGIQRKFIPTGYNPAHVAISEDHSIWVAGSSGHQSTDHMLVHKYSASGEQIGAYLPFSSFPAGTVEPIMPGPDTTILVGGGVVVVTARSGAGSNTNARMREMIRMDESGQVLTRTRLDRATEFMFITGDGVLYSAQNNGAVYRYSPATQSWDHMIRPTTRHWLFGTDGSDLVYRTDNLGKIVMSWYAQP